MKAGQTQIKQGAANIDLMLQNMGFSNDTAFQMTQNLTTLALKLEQVGRAAPGQALQQLESGLMGNVRTLRELGVTVNQTLIDQYAVSKGWIDEGQKLSETGRVYTTYQMILDQTAKATGSLGDANQRYGEQMRQLGVNVENIKEATGSGLKPVVVEALSSINTWLADNTSKVKRWASDFKEGVGVVQSAWQTLQNQNEDSRDLSQLWSTLSPSMQKAVGQAYQSQVGQLDQNGNWQGEAIQANEVPGGVPGWGGVNVMLQGVSDPDYLRRLIASYTHTWSGVTTPQRTAAEQAASAAWGSRPGAHEPATVPTAEEAGAGPGTAGGPPPGMADTTAADKLVQSLQQERQALSACNLEQQQAKALQQAGLDNTDKLTGKTRALAGEISNEVTLLYRAKQEVDADKMLQTLEAERQELFLTDQEARGFHRPAQAGDRPERPTGGQDQERDRRPGSGPEAQASRSRHRERF